MEDLRAQQIEALEVAVPYCEKISNAMNKIIVELEGDKLEDTDEYLNHILKGLNWIIEIYNGTKDLINEKEQVIEKEQINSAVLELNDAIKELNDKKKAEAIKCIVTFVELFKSEAQRVIAE